MIDALMVLNLGSSSIKFALYDSTADKPVLLLRGQVSRVNHSPRLQARWSGNEHPQLQQNDQLIDCELASETGAEAALDALLSWLYEEARDVRLIGAGHRIVHGGADCSAPVRITDNVLADITRANPAAPYHNPVNLLGIHRLRKRMPDLPQVACFDTHFHSTQPPVESQVGLPRHFQNMGIRRYGFHGLSYEYIASELPHHDIHAATGRTLVAHLGNGASLCALSNGRSIATTMGFTALEGLLMGQRCGNLDPGVVLYLQQELGYSADEVADILYRQSGLLGVSGISNDMRELLASEAPTAREAVELFCYRAVREAGALIALLRGLDALVFTGGMGEKSAPIRQRIVEGLGWLGVRLDDQANEHNAQCISSDASAVSVWVLPTDEEHIIARHTHRLLCLNQ